MKIKLSNALTLLRLASIIPIMLLLFLPLPFAKTAALLCYCFALWTDYYDGKYARQRNQVSNFGSLLDSLTDKILSITLFVSFAALHLIPAWIVLVIISREFVITCLALLLESKRATIAFVKGKNLKSISQIVIALAILVICSLREIAESMHQMNTRLELYLTITTYLFAWVGMILAVISGYFYLIRNDFKKIIQDS